MKQGTGNPFQPGSSRYGNLLLLAAWFGLVFGLVEAILLLCLYDFSHLLLWRNGVTPRVLWAGPLINIGLFLVGACFLAVLFALLGRAREGPAWGIAFGLLTGTAIFGLLASPMALQLWGCAVLGLGGGVQGYRWARKNFRIDFFRRTLVPLLVIAAVAGVAGEVWPRWREREFLASLPPAPSGQPNVLLIVMDTCRADHLSTYGYPRATTPNLDRLASEGVLFERAFSPSTSTPPSHLSFLTGLPVHGDWYRGIVTGYFKNFLAETMAKDGYTTVACVANHLWCIPQIGLGKGFARYDVYYHSAGDALTRTFYGRAIAYALRWWVGQYDIIDRKRAPTVNQEFLDWVDETRSTGRPFFAMLNYMETHQPYIAPPPFRTRFSPRVTPRNMIAMYKHSKLPSDLPQADVQLVIDAYDGGLAYLDDWLGQLRAELERRGLLDQTLIIVTADHGEALGEFGQFGHVKPILRQEVTHVPLIIRYPKLVPAGVRIPYPVSLRQLPETVASVVGLGARAPYHGPSLVGSFGDPREAVLSEAGADRAVAFSHWHFISYADGRTQLYNLDSDPREMTNLAGRPEIAPIEDSLRTQLQKFVKEYGLNQQGRSGKTLPSDP